MTGEVERSLTIYERTVALNRSIVDSFPDSASALDSLHLINSSASGNAFEIEGCDGHNRGMLDELYGQIGASKHVTWVGAYEQTGLRYTETLYHVGSSAVIREREIVNPNSGQDPDKHYKKFTVEIGYR